MTKPQWEGLNGKQRWDVIVSLRGPDCQHSDSIKWVTTSVIRWALHTVMRVGGTLNEDLRAIIIPSDPWSLEKEARQCHPSRVMCWSPQHFFQHIQEAAQVCNVPVVTVPNGVFLKAVEQQPPYVCVVVWEWAHTQDGRGDLTKELARHTSTKFGWDVEEVAKQLAAPKKPPKFGPMIDSEEDE